MKVLIVHKNLAVLKAISSFLDLFGLTTIIALNSSQASEQLKACHFDFILTCGKDKTLHSF